jgi:hypothetical protein
MGLHNLSKHHRTSILQNLSVGKEKTAWSCIVTGLRQHADGWAEMTASGLQYISAEAGWVWIGPAA